MLTTWMVRSLPLVLVAMVVASLHSQPGQGSGKRYALVVGINDYDHDGLGKLRYAVNDATKLAEVLREQGYEVVLLTDATPNKPTRANIEAALTALLAKFQRDDTLLIACAGHGFQFGKDVYYCPRDAKPFEDETATMVSLTKIYAQLDRAYRGKKFVMLDACRDDGQRGRRGFDSKSAPTPPQGIGVLLGCSDGEKANEHDDLKHGVFFYHVIEALKGNPKAIDTETGDVTWDSLRTFVKRQVPLMMERLYKGDRQQEPNELGNLRGVPTLVPARVTQEPERAKAPFNPATAKDLQEQWAAYLRVPAWKTLDLGGGAKLNLVLIPPGVFEMGSPEKEKERVPDEPLREVELTQAFYLAMTETTQAQYQAITGENPSYHRDDSLPVENISWNEARTFCERLGRKLQKKASLPTEAQWEFACRAGTTSPFHFGYSLNGEQANSDGFFPCGTETKGPSLAKPTPVGEARYPANAFGLRDMHGNLWEWCQDGYTEDYSTHPRTDPLADKVEKLRVIRGGSWVNDARYSRSASRFAYPPDYSATVVGFRVVVMP